MNNFEKIPLSIQSKLFLKLFNQCEIAQYNQKEQMTYKQSVKQYNDWYAVTDTAEKKGLNDLSLDSTPWLSGLIEADGHFSIRTTLISKNNYPRIEGKFELSQRQVDHKGT